ncbi:hypothetical protein [Shewanella sp. YIC-542]|uniref:hypothetical protein n=1 Tax=Shewanella mytili TaxID=3377111 RepID=UPI00398F28B5
MLHTGKTVVMAGAVIASKSTIIRWQVFISHLWPLARFGRYSAKANSSVVRG